MAESCSRAVPCKIASITVVAVVERKAMKSRYAFDIATEWSDGNKTNCYRSYQEFFTFHCQLLDLFPDEAATTPASKRAIPFLPGKKIFRRSTKGLAEERLPQLDQYMKELMNLPEKVTNCILVKNFIDRNYKEISKEGSPASNEAQDKSQTMKSLQAVKISEQSGIVSYSPVIRSNANPMPSEDDQQRNNESPVNDANSDNQSDVSVPIDSRNEERSGDEGNNDSNPQAVNYANSDNQSDVSVPVDSRDEETSGDEGHGSDKVESSDKEIDHDSVVIEETNEDPSEGQHQESDEEKNSVEETPVEEPAAALLDNNEMEGNSEKGSKESLAEQQSGVENSNEAVEDITTSKDKEESTPNLVEDSLQLDKLTEVNSSLEDD